MSYVKKVIWLAAVVIIAVGCSGHQNGQGDTAENKSAKDSTNHAQKSWALVLHGGAGTISKDKPDSVVKAYKADLNHALTIGSEVLKNGGKSIDAVEKVIRYFEDNPRFNAGKGAVFTHQGGHEMDAAVMIGNTRQAGTVTGIKTVKHPITLARDVLEKSRHVMFAGQGAEKFAGKMGVERVNQDYFYTEERYRSWKRALKRDKKSNKQESSPKLDDGADDSEHELGTVGCVALDTHGTLVAGTSTGGLTDKMYGRVGDVPTVGAGTYASDVVAVSMTGIGEHIMEAVSGHTVSSYMKFKEASLQDAGDYLLHDVLKPNVAGMIAVDKDGHTYMNMNTLGMFRGTVDSKGNHQVAIWK